MKLTSFISTSDLAAGASTGIGSWLKGRIAAFEARRSDRALRRQLADMDDALLRDIGISEDEIWRVRAGHPFVPRNWR